MHAHTRTHTYTHTHEDSRVPAAFYLFMALMATADSSVIADRTLIWKTQAKSAISPAELCKHSYKEVWLMVKQSQRHLPVSPLLLQTCSQSLCPGLPQAFSSLLWPHHCPGAETGSHPWCQSTMDRGRSQEVIGKKFENISKGLKSQHVQLAIWLFCS